MDRLSFETGGLFLWGRVRLNNSFDQQGVRLQSAFDHQQWSGII